MFTKKHEIEGEEEVKPVHAKKHRKVAAHGGKAKHKKRHGKKGHSKKVAAK